MEIKLFTVDEHNPSDLLLLWRCLAERPKRANISHDGKLPKWEDHVEFVQRKPYREWYVIKVLDKDSWMSCGTVYLTRNHEIGISVIKHFRRRGIAEAALRRIIKKDNRQLLANVAPRNYPSQRLFKKLGFVHIQNTYRRSR